MEANEDKCNCMLSVDISTKFSLTACILENRGSEKFLCVTIDRKLNFIERVTNLCDKVSRKIQALRK